MTRVVLLERLKEFTLEAVKDLLLPVPPPHVEDVEEDGAEDFFEDEDSALNNEDNGDSAGEPSPPPPRAASVFLTAMPEKRSAISEAPYILHQVIKSGDFQPSGELPRSEIIVRSVFCVYHENGEEGGLALLNLMERLRIALVRQRVIGRQFTLDLTTAKLETLVYSNTEPPPYGTAPFYLGEMITTWKCPIIKGEVHYGNEGHSHLKRPDPGTSCGRPAGVCGEYGGQDGR